MTILFEKVASAAQTIVSVSLLGGIGSSAKRLMNANRTVA